LSTDTTHGSDGPSGGPHNPSAEPSEEELRAAYEAELSRMTTTDMIAQATVSLLNLGARRLGPEAAGRDLEQARDAIDAARALLGVLERTIPQELRPLRDALSQLQMAYAREIQTGGGGSPATAGGEGAAAAGGEGAAPAGAEDAAAAPGAPTAPAEAPAGEERPAGPGPAQASGRLWVPGS
jgi:hypothetical protein